MKIKLVFTDNIVYSLVDYDYTGNKIVLKCKSIEKTDYGSVIIRRINQINVFKTKTVELYPTKIEHIIYKDE